MRTTLNAEPAEQKNFSEQDNLGEFCEFCVVVRGREFCIAVRGVV
jgi:hypothetical protein